jgi:hypothetical protein
MCELSGPALIAEKQTATLSEVRLRGHPLVSGPSCVGFTSEVSRQSFQMRCCCRGLTSVKACPSVGFFRHVSTRTTVKHVDSAIETPLGMI